MKQIIFILFSFSAFSQTLIVDSITKKPLPFATIKTGTGGFYSGENGRFEYSGKDKLTILFIGYEDYELHPEMIKDTVLMKPKPIQLEEVTVTNNKTISNLGFLKAHRILGSFPVEMKNEIIMCLLPEEPHINSRLKTITIPLSKIGYSNDTDKIIKKSRGLIRVNIYSLHHEMPDEKIYASEPLEFLMSQREKLVVDVSKQMINLPEEGLAFGIELIGRVDTQGNIVPDHAAVRPQITGLKTSDYKAVTYLRGVFHRDSFYPINKINEHLARDIKNYKPQDYNLAIGLEVSK